ncbi:hypothetical protein HDU76_000414 [Blyttiomyces sp. JEL0837]|nr:hypothetical protein HDU76_000414 [Blyttiomyces sp. JEL0837]
MSEADTDVSYQRDARNVDESLDSHSIMIAKLQKYQSVFPGPEMERRSWIRRFIPKWVRIAGVLARRENFSEIVHNSSHIVRDPYRWMENAFDPEIAAFAKEQDRIAKDLIHTLPEYSRFKRFYNKVARYSKYGPPFFKGGFWYYFANLEGKNNQDILYRNPSLEDDAKSTVFLDVNKLSPNGVDQVDMWSFSPDMTRFAFVATKNETDYGWIGFVNVTTGERIPDTIVFTARSLLPFTGFKWLDDGVFYARYPAPSNLTLSEVGINNDRFVMNATKVFHRFGTPQSEDTDCGPIFSPPMKSPQNPICGKFFEADSKKSFDTSSKKPFKRVMMRLEDGQSVDITMDVKNAVDGNINREWTSTASLVSASEVGQQQAQSRASFGYSQTSALVSVSFLVPKNETLNFGLQPGTVFVGKTVDGVSIFKTAKGAKKWKVIGVRLEDGKGDDGEVDDNLAFDVIPEDPKLTLDSVYFLDTNGTLFVTYIDDVKHIIRIHPNLNTKPYIELPLYRGACPSIYTDPELSFASFTYQNLISPGSVYIYNATTFTLETFRKMEINTKLKSRVGKELTMEQMFARSRDGTAMIPLWTVRRAVGMDAENYNDAINSYNSNDKKMKKKWDPSPVWMTGYGGFLVSRMPVFNPFIVALTLAFPRAMFVLVNLRGGNEYGIDWYDSGRNLNKQNVFDDMITAGRFLVAKGWTVPGSIGIQGGSNGGLLAAAVTLQAPELIGVSLPDYGVHDIHRFEEFTGGRTWVNDYGRSENATEAIARLAWSPYDTVVRSEIGNGVKVPPMFFTTGDHDSRVSPLHSFKIVSALQYQMRNGGRGASGDAKVMRRGGKWRGGDDDGDVDEGVSESPVLLRVRELSGHNIFALERMVDAYSEKAAFWAHHLDAHLDHDL